MEKLSHLIKIFELNLKNLFRDTEAFLENNRHGCLLNDYIEVWVKDEKWFLPIYSDDLDYKLTMDDKINLLKKTLEEFNVE